MKWIFLTLIFTLPYANAEVSCLAVKKDLITLEYEIQNSQLDECAEGSTTFCRSINTKADDNLKYADARNKYNQAMAKLIILQGINAISAAIEGSHHSLKALQDPKKLESAKGYIDRLELSLDQAELLDSTMHPVPDKDGNNTNFWYQYAFTHNMSPELFHKNIKDSCELAPAKKTKLCQYTQSEKYQKEPKLKETLYGFAIADMQHRTAAAQSPEDFYEEYKKNLQITDAGTKRSPSDFRETHFKEGGDLAQMKKLIEEYSKTKKTETGLALKKLAIKLDGVNMNYAELSEMSSNPVEKNLQKTFGKALAESKFDFATELSAGISANNLNNQLDVLSQDSRVFKVSLDKKIQAFMEKHEEEFTKCDDDSDAITCLRELCGIKKGSTSCNDNPQLDGSRLTELLESINTFEDITKSTPELEAAKKCYDEITLASKKACLEKVQAGLKDALSKTTEAQLQNEVTKAKDLLTKFQSAAPFTNLFSQKSVMLAAIQNKDCFKKDAIETKNFDLSCGAKDHFSQNTTAINLGEDLEEIALRLTLDQAQELRGERASSASLNQARIDNFKAACNKSKERNLETFTLCKEYIVAAKIEDSNFDEDEYLDEDYEEEYVRIQPSFSQFDNSYFKEEQSGWMRGFKTGALNSLVPAVHAWGSYDYTKYTTKNQLKSIATQEANFIARRDALQNSIKYSDVTPLNYSGGFSHGGYNYYSGFNASSNNFQNSTPIGFDFGNFATPEITPVTTPASDQAQSTGTGFTF